jgi:hypothetical protein
VDTDVSILISLTLNPVSRIDLCLDVETWLLGSNL